MPILYKLSTLEVQSQKVYLFAINKLIKEFKNNNAGGLQKGKNIRSWQDLERLREGDIWDAWSMKSGIQQAKMAR